MRQAEDELKIRPFSLNLLKDLHATLLNGVRGKFKARGDFRVAQNWIGKAGSPIEQAQFIPPAPRQVKALIENWEKYYHLDRPDPLVQLAIIHAQFKLFTRFLTVMAASTNFLWLIICFFLRATLNTKRNWLKKSPELMRLAENESRQVGIKFEALVELSQAHSAAG